MKLDKENSEKNILAQDLEKVETELKQIKLSNGKLCVTSTLLLSGALIALIDLIFDCITRVNFSVVEQILNVMFLGIFGGAAMQLFESIYSNNDKCEKFEEIKSVIVDRIQKIDELEEQSVELEVMLNKPKTKGLVYFPKKNEGV